MASRNECSVSIFTVLAGKILPIIAVCAVWAVASTTPIARASCLDISDVPMDTQLQAAPASVMFVVDDSGSMDWEFMTTEEYGIFQWEYYNFAMDDNNYDNDHTNYNATSRRH
jgi:hypothetical protein